MRKLSRGSPLLSEQSHPQLGKVSVAEWDPYSKSPGAGAFLMQGIVGVVLVPALEAHKCLAKATCLDVRVAEIPRALGALTSSFMRTTCDRAFHHSHPLYTMKMQFIEKFLSVPEIAVQRPTNAGTARPPGPRRGYGLSWHAPVQLCWLRP
jgi:hypothetical protein